MVPAGYNAEGTLVGTPFCKIVYHYHRHHYHDHREKQSYFGDFARY